MEKCQGSLWYLVMFRWDDSGIESSRRTDGRGDSGTVRRKFELKGRREDQNRSMCELKKGMLHA